MITLLSDFGRKDTYVAAMKGVIASISPAQTTCDLTHEIPPQDILAARFNLMMAYPFFPRGTVHLAVVDPGVGSSRRAIALQCTQGFLVGPDNGLFSGVLQSDPPLQAVTLTNFAYWRLAKPSATFHGRDIFAPVAAHLANGVPISELGDRINPASLIQPRLLPFAQFNPATQAADRSTILCVGSIQYIDSFGNLITNIPQSALPNEPWHARLKTPTQNHSFSSIKTYSDLPAGSIGALIGSHGWVEIACSQGSAADKLNNPLQRTLIGTSVKIGRNPDMT